MSIDYSFEDNLATEEFSGHSFRDFTGKWTVGSDKNAVKLLKNYCKMLCDIFPMFGIVSKNYVCYRDSSDIRAKHLHNPGEFDCVGVIENITHNDISIRISNYNREKKTSIIVIVIVLNVRYDYFSFDISFKTPYNEYFSLYSHEFRDNVHNIYHESKIEPVGDSLKESIKRFHDLYEH